MSSLYERDVESLVRVEIARQLGRDSWRTAKSAAAYDRVSLSASTAGNDESVPANVKTRLRELEADFHRDANPVHALEAFAMAHRTSVDLPDWALTFLAGVADRILKIRDEVAGGAAVQREAERVGRALGFGVDGPGRGGWLKHAAILERDRAIYFEVGRERDKGTKLDFAYDAAAKATNVSRSTACRAYQRIRKLNNDVG